MNGGGLLLAGAAALLLMGTGKGAKDKAPGSETPTVPLGSRKPNVIEEPILEQAAGIPKGADVWIVRKDEWAKRYGDSKPWVRQLDATTWVVQEHYVAGLISGAWESTVSTVGAVWDYIF